MSLVGNLEDLSLGDIMQIISLSQKSGVLALESEQGSGRIVFQGGLVQAACLKGRASDLRGLLVDGGWIDPDRFDGAVAKAGDLDLSIEELLDREGEFGAERLDELLRESVEAAILEMFSWRSGDFSFDVRSELEDDDPQLILPAGINAQYLAMEGMRISDEKTRDASPPAAEAADVEISHGESLSTDGMFGDELLETEALLGGEDDAEILELELEVEQDATATDVLVGSVLAREPGLEDTSTDAAPEPARESDTVAREVASALPRASKKTPVILIDPDVSVLEWTKNVVQGEFDRVHVFQQADQGLARIRQYLIRGELPVVLISPETPIDPLSGIRGIADFIKRLKVQAARLTVLGVCEEGESPATSVAAVLDGVLRRPNRRALRDEGPVAIESQRSLVEALHGLLARRRAESGERVGPASGGHSLSLRELRDVTAKLQAASKRGEILPVVLAFGAELFARVAILIVRDESVFAIAEQGMEALEVDLLDSKPPIRLQALDAGWIRDVLASRDPVHGPPATAADRELLVRFGKAMPETAYLGPIESGGSIIAMLYGDQAGTALPLPDTSGLEVVLHHAGLALDRAALERALWQSDAAAT